MTAVDRERVFALSQRLREGKKVPMREWRRVWDAMPVAQRRRLAVLARKKGLSAMGLLQEEPELCVPER